MTSGAFAAAYLDLVSPFAKATGHRAVTVTTSTGVGEDSIPSRLRRGERADVIILPEAALDDLIKQGRVVADTRSALARSAIGMAVRAGARKPDIGSVDALKRTLLQAKSVAYSGSVSGLYLVNELFPKLGIASEMKAKSQRIDRERVGEVVARGEAEIGFQQISELLPIKGIDYVGPLPADAQRVTVVSAGVAADASSPEGARALIKFLASPEGVRAMRKYQLEPMTSR
jgi:molybdate transport system substrate-binding protein